MAAEKDVVMYCRSWCGDCSRARVWLHAKGVAFREIDIEEHPEAARTVRDMAGKIITPCFEIDGEPVVDFDEARLSELLF